MGMGMGMGMGMHSELEFVNHQGAMCFEQCALILVLLAWSREKLHSAT